MDEIVCQALSDALSTLKNSKPNDRSERDRRYAVLITEMEKVLAYAFLFLVTAPDPVDPKPL